MNINDVKKVLIEFASQLDACDKSIKHLRNINTANELRLFLHKYMDFIPDIYNIEEFELNESNIIQWFESPFISDYDKNRVKEYLNQKP